jgi:hypothetical protein
MFDNMNPALLTLLAVVGSLLFLGLGTVLFRAGCSLADVPEPSLPKSLVLFTLASVVSLPPAIALVWYAGTLEADPTVMFGTMRILAGLVALVLIWGLSALLYAGGLHVQPKKSLMIAGSELFLMGLLGSLLTAVVLVALSVAQIFYQPPPSTRLSQAAPVVEPAALELP